MIRFALPAILLLGTSAPAFADALEDRFLVAQQNFQDRMEAFYTSRVPELGALMPDFMADERARDSMVCVLDHIRDEGGEDMAELYVSSIEEMGSAPFENMEDLAGIPDEIPSDMIFGGMRSCDNIGISQELMAETGFLEVISNPETLQAFID